MGQALYTVHAKQIKTEQPRKTHNPFSQGPSSQGVGEMCKHIIIL